MKNPYDIIFGRRPIELIERFDEKQEIIDSFSNGNNPSPIYILTGPRGCGKTVTLGSIADYFENQDKWIVIDLNPHQDLEAQLAAFLYQSGHFKHMFKKEELDSLFTGKYPQAFNSIYIDKMLEHLKKKKINVLITIDEVINNQYMKIFAHSFQSYIRHNFDVSLVMTGLYENISALENEKSLTFLYRAPKMYLKPLNLRLITNKYVSMLNMSQDDAKEAALTTKGYAFAYQIIGYILFKRNKTKIDKEVLDEFDALLDERSYSKIYSELTNREKEIVNLIANEKKTNEEIKEILQLKDGTLSTYKGTLFRKGIVDMSKRGEMEFLLPRFKEFVSFHEKI